MSRWERNALGFLLWATTCSSCAHRSLVPMRLRPDTRQIWGIHLDSLALLHTFQILQAALPNEGAICYSGELADTVYVNPRGLMHPAKLLVLHDAVASRTARADSFHVYFSKFLSGCDNKIVAVGHSHPYSAICDQSNDDANAVFVDVRALASLVWCTNGEVQVLYQDGRRDVHRWRAEP